MLPPITKLAVFGQQFSDGTKFNIVTDLPTRTFKALFDAWYALPTPFNEESFIFYVKIHHPDCICVTKAQYDEITEGKKTPATKEEYEAQGKARK